MNRGEKLYISNSKNKQNHNINTKYYKNNNQYYYNNNKNQNQNENQNRRNKVSLNLFVQQQQEQRVQQNSCPPQQYRQYSYQDSNSYSSKLELYHSTSITTKDMNQQRKYGNRKIGYGSLWKSSIPYASSIPMENLENNKSYNNENLVDENNDEDEGGVESTKTSSNPFMALYKFSRPHTIRGTILASVMGVVRCIIDHPDKLSLKPLPLAVLGMIALLCGNVFIVGINQIYDIEIDRVNKPFLPLAANTMSKVRAWTYVCLSCFLGMTITRFFFSNLIFGMYTAGIVAGTVYSIPPFYFKQFPLIAAITIAFVRGFSLNFGVYYAVRESLGIPFTLNPIVLFITRFMTVFATVIAITKDLPDTEGDIKHNVNTFAAKLGIKKMAKLATTVLSINYLVAILEGIFNREKAFRQVTMIGGHAILGFLLYRRSRTLDEDTKSIRGIKKYYSFIWKLFYAEYCLYPFL